MQIDGWKYYNHAAIPTTAPHEAPDESALLNGDVWSIDGGTPLLARWTTEFDCGHETNWWYVIKDTPFDINALKAKRRYEINKGIKNFYVKEIDPTIYGEDLYNVQIAAFSAYPQKYRPTVVKEKFLTSVETWRRFVCFGAFHKETGELCGYALLLKESEQYIDFCVLKTCPEHEKNGVNAALVYIILEHFNSFFVNGGYICDGSRSINHETAFQDYLEKYFEFRKSYCKLHIKYNPKLKWAISMAYPLRKILLKFDGVGVLHQLNAVLRMEEIARENNE